MHCPNRLAASVLLCLLLCGSRLHAQTPPQHPPDPQAAAHRAQGKALADKYDYQSAIREYQQAYALDKTAHREDATLDLNHIGNCYLDTNQYPLALNTFRQEIEIEKQIGDQEGEATTLSDMGLVYDNLSQYDKALDFYQQALPIQRQIGDQEGEAATLGNIGAAYVHLSQYDKALDFYQQALTIQQQIGDKTGEATTLDSIGVVYDSLNQYAKALDSYQQALSIRQQVGDRAGEAATLHNIGTAYRELGQYHKALTFYQQALPIEQQIGNRAYESATLGNIGDIYGKLSQYDKALHFYQQALPIEQQIGDKVSEAWMLNNIASVQREKGQYDKALVAFQQALRIVRQVGYRNGEATALNNIGSVYNKLNQYVKALDSYQQALTIHQQVGDRDGEARTLNNIMLAWKALNQPNLAIFYGKQAVNVYQSIRANNQTLDKQSQKSYLAANVGAYRALASLLISQGRLPEAQQILRLLKEQEFFDYLHGSTKTMPTLMDSAALTRREARNAQRYATAAAPLAALGQEQQALRQKKTLSPDEQKQSAALNAKAKNAQTNLTAALAQIAKDFSSPPNADDAPPQTVGAQDVGKALRPGTVAVYTIVAPDKLDLIVVTPAQGGKASQTLVRTFPIKSEDLYKKVYAFRQALTHPTLDPRPLGAELFQMVFGPIQKDLDNSHTTTILFSLDDALRYVPPAALYDDKAQKYVAEEYRTEIITLVGSETTPAAPAVAPAVLGLGVSEARDGAPPLPGVRNEMAAISGLFPSKRLLDAQFTQTAMLDALAPDKYPLVHIASHFALYPTDAASYLLLGDGTEMSVAQMKQHPNLFAGVNLLTLSACDTAMEIKNSSGKEIEGFGALAQQLGARSVVASLWPVSDAATPVWMQAFYDAQKQNPTASLAEALRQAQLAMLGRTAPLPEPGHTQRAGRAVEDDEDTTSLPAFKTDMAHPYAHPYYWAPFVLIGNWQ